MAQEDEVLMLALTKREANELFARCLKSHEEDNDESREVLKKLARLLGRETAALRAG